MAVRACVFMCVCYNYYYCYYYYHHYHHHHHNYYYYYYYYLGALCDGVFSITNSATGITFH